MKNSQLSLISVEEIMNLTRQNNLITKGASELVMAAFGYNKLNHLYQKLSDKSGIEFIESVISNL